MFELEIDKLQFREHMGFSKVRVTIRNKILPMCSQ